MNVNRIQFDGLDALEITTSQVRLVAITALGPRIAFLGKRGGANLFYWKQDDKGYGGWRVYGGHRIWVTRPGADEAEDAYMPDNAPCRVEVAEKAVTLTGAMDPTFKVARGLRISVVDEITFRVTGFVTNNGPMLYSAGIWGLTCSDPSGGKEYGIPLYEPNGVWETARVVIPRKWAGHVASVNDSQISMNDEFMIIRPQGVESKRGIMAAPGIIAMTAPAQGLTLIKRAVFNPAGSYPMHCNLSFYIGPDNFMVEMETMGEERTILPGATLENTETWKIVDEVFDWQDSAHLRELMAQSF
ncbi:MAG: hypothetical protein WCF84_11035 [Anaerolineae bacterium]